MATSSAGKASERDQTPSTRDEIEVTSHDQSDDSDYEIVNAKLARFLRKSNLKKAHAPLIDLDLIDEDITNNSTDIHRNSWVAARIKNYLTTKRCHNDILLVEYQEDFEEWTEEDFDKINKDILRELRNALVFKGVNIKKGAGKKIARSLAVALNWEYSPAWTAESLNNERFAPDTRAHYFQRMAERGDRLPTFPHPSHGKERKVQFQQQDDDGADGANTDGFGTIPSIEHEDTLAKVSIPGVFPSDRTQFPTSYVSQRPVDAVRSSPLGPQIRTPPVAPILRPPSVAPSVPAFTARTLPRSVAKQVEDLPPPNVPNEAIEPTTVVAFNKVWRKEDSYTGENYDVLDDRIRLFMRTCRAIGIRPGQYADIFNWAVQGAAKDYMIHSMPEGLCFADMYVCLKNHFDTENAHAAYYVEWTCRTFESTKNEPENVGKPLPQILDSMLNKFALCQRALGNSYGGERILIDTVTRACRTSPEFDRAMEKSQDTYESLRSNLHASLTHYLAKQGTTFLTKATTRQGAVGSTHLVDRKYNSNRPHSKRQENDGQRSAKKRCWICGKEDHFSTMHSKTEQDEHKTKWRRQRQIDGRHPSKAAYAHFLMEYEGEEDSDSDNDFVDVAEYSDAAYFTMAATLSNNAFLHRLSGIVTDTPIPASQFLLDRYSSKTFQGILPDTGAASSSTAGLNQVKALQRERPDITLNKDQAGHAKITFGNGKPIESIGTVAVDTPVGLITFHVLETETPFLMCLDDMDRLQIYLDNTLDQLVSRSRGINVPVIRKWGHPWFFLAKEETAISFLAETELRRLHRRFGHPAAGALHRLLARAGHDDVKFETLATMEKFCHHCQMNAKAPTRFRFTIHDDCEFNYRIIVDVMFLDGRPVLHVVDEATAFHAGGFLKSLSAEHTWEKLKQCWSDTYLGPPDLIRHDLGTNFASAEFGKNARFAGITMEPIPVEAHWTIGKVERYHAPIRRAYEIFSAELPELSPDARLQAAFKAVNDTAGPNGLVPTLLVFGAYPRVNADSPPSATLARRAQATAKAMAELRKLAAKRKINDALNTRNGPDVTALTPSSLELGTDVRVYREKDKWTGPWKVLAVSPGKVTVDLPNGAGEFAATHVKPYHRHPDGIDIPTPDTADNQDPDDDAEPAIPFEYPAPVAPRKRGRPRKLPIPAQFMQSSTQFLSTKEQADFQLAIQLRNDGEISTPGAPFQESDAAEIDGLMIAGVLKPELWDAAKHSGIRIFKSRMVREVKGKGTGSPYEKSRLVVQGYGDEEKKSLLTQSPTIQRCSQRLILALAPTLMLQGMTLELRDISQAYVQSKSTLAREFLMRLPIELKDRYPGGTILRVMKPLYGIAEAGLHWFATYTNHHQDKLFMEPSAYDPCLLITKAGKPFGMTGLQTDDTLMLGEPAFMALEEAELKRAQFRAKERQDLTGGSTGDFNGCRLSFDHDYMVITQKGQADRIELATNKAEYVEQRARGAYIASICQPEATFDFSVAAQAVDPTDADLKQLNARLLWQQDNKPRGLRFVPLDLSTAKLMVFADGSFANNKDLTSQIGYVICLVNEEITPESFTVTGNLVHWQSSKCKRVTRSVLASEIYGLVNGFDLGYVLAETLRTIMNRLDLPPIPLVICTDSYSLYDCLVKLGTTTEKRLMIDLMALRQSYERREISEIRWINGEDNPADAMTKSSANRALEGLVSSNSLTVRLEAWVERKGTAST